MAIVVSSPGSHSPPPPATANQQQCKYSVRESYDTYVCYTEEQMQQKRAQEAREQAESDDWIVAHWWQILMGLSVILVFCWWASSAGDKYRGW